MGSANNLNKSGGGIDNYLSFNGWENLPLMGEGDQEISHPFFGLDMDEHKFSGVRFHIVGNELSRVPVYESGKKFIENNKELEVFKGLYNINIESFNINHIKTILEKNSKVYCLLDGETIQFYIEKKGIIENTGDFTNLAVKGILF